MLLAGGESARTDASVLVALLKNVYAVLSKSLYR